MNQQPTPLTNNNPEKLLQEPTYPEDWECCDNGCEELCVYEIYRTQKQAYDAQQAQIASAKDSK
ncbi:MULTISPECIES: oxidoreductase-like domain-containing protein [unclassified Moraxella]|uniref:oxidoreductase-like domain-containing protein n=1 Tax=unclassified Moraxella TaxID=2685852 RepID=UPI003AF6E8C2